MQLATVGHSTRSSEEFIAILQAHGIARLVDVRRFPASRRLPQFAGEALATALATAGIGYAWMEDLGGRRSGSAPEAAAWRVAGFRGYATYMRTPAFAAALDRLLADAASAPTAIMCAEALWTRCHRRLIADACVARGVTIVHLMGVRRVEPHRLPPFAVVAADGSVSYPVSAVEPGQQILDLDPRRA